MVNGERVVLMSRMAAHMEHRGKQDMKINQYYRGDYVGFELVKSVIGATVIYFLLIACYAVYHFDTILQEFYQGNWASEGMRFLLSYVVLLAGYCIISYIVYSRRYSKMRKGMKSYFADLKKLDRMYEKE